MTNRKVVEQLGEGIAKVLRPHLEAIAKELKAQRDRIKELENQPIPKWCGPFREGNGYRELSFVVHGGSLWIAKTNTNARPGQSSDWQLCTKSRADK